MAMRYVSAAFLALSNIDGSDSFQHRHQELLFSQRNRIQPQQHVLRAVANDGDDSRETTMTTTTTNGARSRTKKKQRPADFPPYVMEIAENDDEELRRMPLFVRQEGEGKDVTRFRAVVNRCVPKSSSPWWFGFTDGINLQFGSIKILSKSARETRLRNERSYSRKGPFSNEFAALPPTICDLSTPQLQPKESFWISLPARLLSYAVAYYSFPFIAKCVDSFVTMPADQLDEITSKFGPGISILYGTFISLTLSILYNRQKTIQEVVSIETAQLSVLAQDVVSLFQKDAERAVRAAQCVADQIRILVSGSRGEELLVLIYSDPYARLRELLDEYEMATPLEQQQQTTLLASSRDVIKEIYQSRATRLSDESLALPPTHFLILNVLTLFMLLGFTVNIIPTVDRYGSPSSESCLLFAALFTIYILFYNFASDLNLPFQGVYQVRRSTASAHLLQLKWFLSNHKLLRGKIDFDDPAIDESENSVRIESPGLGEFRFHKI